MLLPLILALISPAAAQLARGPYIVDAKTNAATVCWRFSDGTDSCFEKTGIKPGAPFLYTVPGVKRTFRGHPLPPKRKPTRFAVFGDMGNGKKGQLAVARRLEAWKPEFVLLVGDLVYPKGHDRDYDEKYFRPYAGLLASIPFLPAIGNHDYGFRKRRKAEKRFRKHYARIHRKPKYYSFDAGFAHFVSLDTNYEGYGVKAAAKAEKGSPQWRWLDEDLSRSQARWKIIFLHVPLHASGVHGSNTALIEALGPLFEKHGVDLVFQGHNHHYERSAPIHGVVYVVAGAGGAELYRRWRWHRWSKKFVKSHGFVGVSLNRDRLRLEFIDDEGAVRDRHDIAKP